MKVMLELEEASTHKTATTHAGTIFVPRDPDLWPFNPKINGFPSGLVSSSVILAAYR